MFILSLNGSKAKGLQTEKLGTSAQFSGYIVQCTSVPIISTSLMYSCTSTVYLFHKKVENKNVLLFYNYTRLKKIGNLFFIWNLNIFS